MKRSLLRVTMMSLLVAPNVAFSGPVGEQVVAGGADIQRPNSQTTVVRQNTARVAINWANFSINKTESVLFQQPSSSAVALNRVVGVSPSQILGKLTANGQVILVNPRGVFFGHSARVDVAGLVATTLHISNDDFMQGQLKFSRVLGAPAASVVNAGELNASDGGYIVLAGDHVDNKGIIQANLGQVTLASVQHMTLDLVGDGLIQFAIDATAVEAMSGVVNSGTILAAGGSVLMTAALADDLIATAVRNDGVIRAQSIFEHEGEIILSALSGDAINAGVLDVSGSADVDGGRVQVLGDRVGLIDSAMIDASGRNGGEILIGGNLQGQGEVRTAQVTHVGADVALHADAMVAGDGGTIILWADGDTQFQGALSATGGEMTGNGGFVEVSGKHGLIFAGSVDLFANNGHNGTLLLDPFAIAIVNVTDGVPDALSADAANLVSPFNPLANDFVATDLNGEPSDGNFKFFAFSENPDQTAYLDADVITNLLEGINVTLQAQDAIVVDEAIINTDGGALTLQSDGMIGVFADITLTGGDNAKLRLDAGAITISGNVAADGDVTFIASGDIVLTNGAQVQADSNRNGTGNILLTGGGDVLTESGVELAGFNITISADDALLGHNVNADNAFVTNATGRITLSGVTTTQASVVLTAGADIAISNNVIADRNVTITAVSDISLSNGAQVIADSNQDALGNVLLRADSMLVGVGDVVTTSDTLIMGDNTGLIGANVRISGSLVAAEDIALIASNTIRLDGNAQVRANNNDNGVGDLALFADALFTAEFNEADLFAFASVNDAERSNGVGDVVTQSGAVVNAVNAFIVGVNTELGHALTVDNALAVQADQSITLTGANTTLGAVDLSAGQDIVQTAGSIQAQNGGLQAQAGNNVMLTNVSVGANTVAGGTLALKVTAANEIDVANLRALNGNEDLNISIDPETVIVSGDVIASGDITMVANGDIRVINGAQVDAGQNLTLTANFNGDGLGGIEAQTGTLLAATNANLSGVTVTFDQTNITGEFIVNNAPFVPATPIAPNLPDQNELFYVGNLSESRFNPSQSIDSWQEAIAEGGDPTELLEATAAGEEEDVPLSDQPLIRMTDRETSWTCVP